MVSKKIKTAIAHDSYLYLGGAERVLDSLLKIYPKADVFIPLISEEFEKKIGKKHKLKTSFLNKLPFKKNLASFLKPFVLIFWRNLDLSNYDLVISSSHSFSSKSVRTGNKTLHVSYIHTPPRYLYEEFNEMNWIKKQPWKYLLSPILNYLRRLDFEAAQKPNLLIANSKTVKKRIKKYYRKNSLVIYPPIKINKKLKPKKNGEYYLFHSRLVKQKGCGLVVKTFNQTGKKLVVVGAGKEENKLRRMAKNNISFLGFVPDKKLSKIYQEAKALIYASLEEDLGLIPIEAMSYGVPVIAYESGGIRETVINNQTGILFKKYTTKSLIKAIDKFEKNNQKNNVLAKNCKSQAQKFSVNKFEKKIEKLINSKLPSGVK